MSVTEGQLGLRGCEASGGPGVPLQPRTWMQSCVPCDPGAGSLRCLSRKPPSSAGPTGQRVTLRPRLQDGAWLAECPLAHGLELSQQLPSHVSWGLGTGSQSPRPCPPLLLPARAQRAGDCPGPQGLCGPCPEPGGDHRLQIPQLLGPGAPSREPPLPTQAPEGGRVEELSCLQ